MLTVWAVPGIFKPNGGLSPKDFGAVLGTVECTAISREFISSFFSSNGLKKALEAFPWLYPLLHIVECLHH